MEYASKAQGNAGVALGIIGTSLGAIANAGGLMGILGAGRNSANISEGDRPVTRYEMGLIQSNNSKDNEITLLKAQRYTDHAMAGVQMQIGQQNTWNAAQQANLGCLQRQIDDLMGITRRFVPNANVAPGWGMAAVVPLPPPAPSSSSGSASANSGA